MWYYKDNGERLLEQGSPVRSYDTASLSEYYKMTTLCATGYENGVPVYLWSYGDYRYELEVRKTPTFTKSTVFDASYEEAMRALENVVDNGEITFSIE